MSEDKPPDTNPPFRFLTTDQFDSLELQQKMRYLRHARAEIERRQFQFLSTTEFEALSLQQQLDYLKDANAEIELRFRQHQQRTDALRAKLMRDDR